MVADEEGGSQRPPAPARHSVPTRTHLTRREGGCGRKQLPHSVYP
jgi:hypothetical protein